MNWEDRNSEVGNSWLQTKHQDLYFDLLPDEKGEPLFALDSQQRGPSLNSASAVPHLAALNSASTVPHRATLHSASTVPHRAALNFASTMPHLATLNSASTVPHRVHVSLELNLQVMRENDNSIIVRVAKCLAGTKRCFCFKGCL